MTLLIAAGVLLVLALAVELVVGHVVHDRTTRALTEAIGGEVRVHVHGRPLTLDLLRREVPHVEITARKVPVGERPGQISRLDILLWDVQLPREGVRVTADSGRFDARLENGDIAALVDLPPAVRSLRLDGDALRIETAGGLSFDTSVTAEDGALVIRADRGILGVLPRAEFRIPLEDLPAGAVVESAEVVDGVLHARGPLDGTRLVPGA